MLWCVRGWGGVESGREEEGKGTYWLWLCVLLVDIVD
jgi:hypothetical protein